ncbi:MAG: hypothetical protein JSR87_14950 [Proteobacteria bacterium]|nr:hypothetical protein [Pseudomonadota bacterium]MBS0572922.1 hypothetical protein [Pseudomonadota bacterium]
MAKAPVVCLDTSSAAFRTDRCGAERTAFSVARQACSAAFLSRPARPVPGGMRTPAPVQTPAPGCNARIRYALCVGETVRPPAAVTGPACDADAPVDRCAKASARPDPALTAAGVRG